jgi:hypothetical protein
MGADLPCVSGTLNRSAWSYRQWDEKLSWIELSLKTVIEPTVRFPSLKEERLHFISQGDGGFNSSNLPASDPFHFHLHFITDRLSHGPSRRSARHCGQRPPVVWGDRDGCSPVP